MFLGAKTTAVSTTGQGTLVQVHPAGNIYGGALMKTAGFSQHVSMLVPYCQCGHPCLAHHKMSVTSSSWKEMLLYKELLSMKSKFFFFFNLSGKSSESLESPGFGQ